MTTRADVGKSAMFFSLELVNLRNVIRDFVVVALVGDKDVFAGFEAGRVFKATGSDSDALFIVHAIKQAGTAGAAKSTFGPVGGRVPCQRIVAEEGYVFEFGVGCSPIMAAGLAALSAMAE